MSTTKGVKIKYKGDTIHNLPGDGEFKLLTKEKYVEDDFDIEVNRDADLGAKAISANGSYSASSDELDGYSQVTVDVPNSYSASDEGKVVDSGALVAQTSRTIDENGTYDTTLNDEVVVDVAGGGGGGGVWQETAENDYAIKFTPSNNGSSGRSGGFKFVSAKRIKVSKIRVFPRGTTTNAYISLADGTTVASVTNATVVAGEWNDLTLQTPVTLEADTEYVVWYSTLDVAYKYASGTPTKNLDYIIVKSKIYSTSYNTFPTTNDSGFAGVDIYVDSYYEMRQAVLTTKSITQNGTYSAEDDNADGYSEVTVNVSGGGTSDIDTSLLPNSDSTKVLMSQADNIAHTNHWGRLSLYDKDVTRANPITIGQDGSFQFAGDTFGTFPLSQANVDVTVYVLAKVITLSGGDLGIFGITYAKSNGNSVLFYTRYTAGYYINTSTYGNDTQTQYTINDYALLAVSVNQTTKKARFFINGNYAGEKSFSNTGNQVIFNSFGLSDTNTNVCAFKYMGIVDECEADADIIANSQYLMAQLMPQS